MQGWIWGSTWGSWRMSKGSSCRWRTREQRRVNRLWAVARLEGRQFKRLLLAHAGELGVSIKQAL